MRTGGLERVGEVDSASPASYPWPELTVAEPCCPPGPRHRDTSIDSRLPLSLQAMVTMPISSRPTQSRAMTDRLRIPHSTTMREVRSMVGRGPCPGMQTWHRHSSSDTTLLELAVLASSESQPGHWCRSVKFGLKCCALGLTMLEILLLGDKHAHSSSLTTHELVGWLLL